MTILTVEAKTLEVADVRCTDADLMITLRDGRKLTAPLWWYPRLQRATAAQRSRWELAGAGRGIHWPEIDEDISLEGLLRGAKDPRATPPADA